VPNTTRYGEPKRELTIFQSKKPRGGGGRRDTRGNTGYWPEIERTNPQFESYYNDLAIVPEEEKQQFWEAMRRDLPTSFRFTGSKG
jgi:multisite-specific tRNA:(cytosine-C5)-methyltransferase